MERRGFRLQDGRIVTDTFEIKYELRGRQLSLSLNSDLGDAASLMVGVSRDYQERGSTVRYPVAYHDEASTVGAWRQARTIDLDDERWAAQIDNRRRALAASGDPITLGSISDSIEISFVVPVNQDPPFERWNANLHGAVVSQSGELRVVKRTIPLYAPLDVQLARTEYADPLGLERGTSYRASRLVTLMPEFEPADPMAAIARIRRLEPGTAFTVLETREKVGSPWYRVRTAIGEGWINSTALIGQTVTSVP